jgi:hypothetical protein
MAMDASDRLLTNDGDTVGAFVPSDLTYLDQNADGPD